MMMGDGGWGMENRGMWIWRKFGENFHLEKCVILFHFGDILGVVWVGNVKICRNHIIILILLRLKRIFMERAGVSVHSQAMLPLIFLGSSVFMARHVTFKR